LDFTRVVHGTQEYVVERPLRVGETLVLSPSLESVRVRSGTVPDDPRRRPRRRRRTGRHGAFDDDRAGSRRVTARPFDGVTVGDELPELARVVIADGRPRRTPRRAAT
jgi:hypothetical protein